MSSLDDINDYIESGDYKRALEQLNIIISKEPNNALAYYLRGKSSFVAIQLSNNNSNYDANTALIYSHIELDLNKAIELDDSIIDAYRGLMYLNRAIKNIDEERLYAQVLIEKDPKSYDAFLLLGSSYLNNGISEADFHQAIAYYNEFINNMSSSYSKVARFERGLCYYNLGIFEKADIEANKLIIDFPMYDDAYFLKGITLSKGFDYRFYDDAIFFLERALELNENNYNAMYEASEWYFNKEEYKKAICLYDKLLDNNKYTLEALAGKAEALHDMIVYDSGKYYDSNIDIYNDIEENIRILDRVIYILGDNSLQYRYYKSNIYIAKKDFDSAKIEYHNALRDIKNIDSWFYEAIAEFYYNYADCISDYKNAIKYLNKINYLDRKISTYNLFVFIYNELKDYRGIINICDEFFLKINSNSFNNDDLYNDYENIYYIRFMYAYSLEMTLSTDYELIIENYRFCLNSSKLDKALIYCSISKIMMDNLIGRYYFIAMDYLKEAMKLDSSYAYYLYAKELFFGDIISSYPEVSFEILNNIVLVDRNLDVAYALLGMCYELGRGVSKDENKAFEIYYRWDRYIEINNSKSTVLKGMLAHCYYNGIGVNCDRDIAFNIVRSAVYKRGKNCDISIILLYSYFALMGYDGFVISRALLLFNENLPYYRDLATIMMIKRLYKTLNKKKELKLAIKKEISTIKNTGEFSLLYFRPYLKNFNIFYPFISGTKMEN